MNKYRPEIDGLRTIAVFAVIIFHLNPIFLKGGYYGVDVFFVISGYLITSHLIKEITNDTFSVFRFWLRRVKRLLPTLLTVILTVLLIAPLLIFKTSFVNILGDVFPAIFSYFNFHAYFDYGDYWGTKADNSFFLHTWSLSLEEQFYLLYPLLLLGLNKLNISFIKALIIFTLISSFLFIFYLPINKDRVFYMLPFRFWELSIGGVISLISTSQIGPKIKNALTNLGIVLIILCFIIAPETITNIIFLPIIGSCLIISFCSSETIIGKILSSKIFLHFGKLSYSMYLWHWPVIVLFKNLYFQTSNINIIVIYLIILLITYILSLFTYYIIENKTRNYKFTPQIVLSTVAVISFLILFYKSPNFEKHYKSSFNQQTYYSHYFNLAPLGDKLDENDGIFYNSIIPPRPQAFNDAYSKEGIISRINNEDPKVIILGDSHGTMWAKTFQEITQELHVSSSIFTTNAAWPFFNIDDINKQESNNQYTVEERILYAKALINGINNWKPNVVILACRWDGLDDRVKHQLITLLDYISKKNIKTILINQPPVLYFMRNLNANQFLTYLDFKPVDGYNKIELSNQSEVKEANDYINTLKRKFNNVTIFDVNAKMCEGNKVKVSYNKEILYLDEDHLSYKGAQLFKSHLKNIIIENLK